VTAPTVQSSSSGASAMATMAASEASRRPGAIGSARSASAHVRCHSSGLNATATRPPASPCIAMPAASQAPWLAETNSGNTSQAATAVMACHAPEAPAPMTSAPTTM